MGKIVAMIPARLGSQRVKNKNLRLINGKPLISFIIEAAVQAKAFDEIYINSESEIFEEISARHGVKFYKRQPWLASHEATNDDFALDFMNNIKCDVLIQLLATSPFITKDEISGFVNKLISENFDTLISVRNIQIECVYDKKPVNFDQKAKTPPSQLLKPVQAYACGLMGWRSRNFKKNIKKYMAAYHGGDGKIGFFELNGFSTIDIDNEEDFQLAEFIAKSKEMPKAQPGYYEKDMVYDADRKKILIEDGVHHNILSEYNKELININSVIESNGRTKSWSYTLVNSPSTCATLIAQMPGEGNRQHYHRDWDEWWYIVEGAWEYFVEGQTRKVRQGDVVFIQRNRRHKITAAGDKMAIRLAVSRQDVDHIYTEVDYKAMKQRRRHI